MARLLIDGHCVVSPFLPRVRFTLTGHDSPALRALLTGEPQSVRGICQEFALTLAGQRLDLGPVVFFHPRAAAEDGHPALAALHAGQADGTEITVRPTGRERFRLRLLSTTVDAETAPVPLGLPGFPEPS